MPLATLVRGAKAPSWQFGYPCRARCQKGPHSGDFVRGPGKGRLCIRPRCKCGTVQKINCTIAAVCNCACAPMCSGTTTQLRWCVNAALCNCANAGIHVCARMLMRVCTLVRLCQSANAGRYTRATARVCRCATMQMRYCGKIHSC